MLTIRVKNYPDVARTTFIVRDERRRIKNHYVVAVDLTADATHTRNLLGALLSIMGREDTVEITTFGSHTRTRTCGKNDPFIFEMLKRTESSSNPMIALSCKTNAILISDGNFTEGPSVEYISKLTGKVLCLSIQQSANMEKLASLTGGTYYVAGSSYEENKKDLRKILNLGEPETFNIKIEAPFGSIDISPLCAGESIEINTFTPESGEAVLTYMDMKGISFKDEVPYTPEEIHHMKSCKMFE